MIRSFRNKGTEDRFNGEDTKAGCRACPQQLWKIARRKLDMVNNATRLTDLKAPPNNKLEALKGKRAGQHSIRINDQYRVCFRWTNEGAAEVEVTDYH